MEQIRAASNKPIGIVLQRVSPIKNEIVIIFDDISRSKRVAELVPYVLEELEVTGILETAIRFICTTDNYGHTF